MDGMIAILQYIPSLETCTENNININEKLHQCLRNAPQPKCFQNRAQVRMNRKDGADMSCGQGQGQKTTEAEGTKLPRET